MLAQKIQPIFLLSFILHMPKTEELQELFRKIYQDSDELENPNLITSNQNFHLTSHSNSQHQTHISRKSAVHEESVRVQERSATINQSLEESDSCSSNIIPIFKSPTQLISNQTSRIQLFKMAILLNQQNSDLKRKIKNQIGENQGEKQLKAGNLKGILKEQGSDLFNFKEEVFVDEQKVKKQLQDYQLELYERNVKLLRMKIEQKKISIQKLKISKIMQQKNLISMREQWESLSDLISEAHEKKIKLIQKKKKQELKIKNENKVERLISEYLETLDKASKEEVFQSRMFKRSMQFLDPNYDMSKMWALNSQSKSKSDQSDSNATLSPYIDFQDEVIRQNVPKLKKLKNSGFSMSSKQKPPTPSKKIADSFQSFKELQLKNSKNDKLLLESKIASRSLKNSSRQKEQKESSRNYLNPNSITRKSSQKRSFM